MGLDLWFRDDVARILAAAYEAMHSSTEALPPADPETAEVYRRGFEDALRSVALGFGLLALNLPPARQERQLVWTDSKSLQQEKRTGSNGGRERA